MSILIHNPSHLQVCKDCLKVAEVLISDSVVDDALCTAIWLRTPKYVRTAVARPENARYFTHSVKEALRIFFSFLIQSWPEASLEVLVIRSLVR